MALVSRVKVENNLKEAVAKAVEQIGGFDQFINRGEKVLLKPNFNTADPFPASSGPAFLKAVTELVYEAGASQVIIGDSATMAVKTRQVMEKLGIFDLEKSLQPPPKILVFEEGGWVKKKITQGKYLKSASVPEILDQVHKLILLPCLKTHFLAQFTGSLKIAVGFMKPIERLHLHAGHLTEKIAELNSIINPDLIIMDARKCFINKGPSEGELAQPNLILASQSRIDIDIEGIKIIQGYDRNSLAGIQPEDIGQIKRARELEIK